MVSGTEHRVWGQLKPRPRAGLACPPSCRTPDVWIMIATTPRV